MKKYDYKKAQDLIEENKDHISSAALGMRDDWFWTADTVWSGGEYKKDLKAQPEIGGIKSSTWATPCLQLEFKDGSERFYDCFIDDGINTDDGWRPQMGVLSGPCQDYVERTVKGV